MRKKFGEKGFQIGRLVPEDSEVRIWVGGKLMYIKVPQRQGGGGQD